MAKFPLFNFIISWYAEKARKKAIIGIIICNLLQFGWLIENLLEKYCKPDKPAAKHMQIYYYQDVSILH